MKNQIISKIIQQGPHLSWLKDKTVFITLHGSRAYGTHTETSDFDYKGICLCPKEFYLGQRIFEQAELKDPNPDTVIYELRKFAGLAGSANPNIIETLYTDPSDHIYIDDIGQELLDNRDLFLSKRLRHSFSGYAFAQLKKMSLRRQWIINPPKQPPTRKEMGLPERTVIPQDQLTAAQASIQKELDKFQFDFMGELNEPTKIAIQNIMSEMLAEMKISSEQQWLGAARKIGLDDNFIQLMQLERSYLNKKREWDTYNEWKRNRNPKRAADEEKYFCDLKNAYHLIRLVRMAKEIITTGKVIVKRPDREELLAIRRGAWTYEQIVEYAEKQDKELSELYKSCNVLPKTPDQTKIDKLCIKLIEKSLSRYSWYNIKKYLTRYSR